MVQAPGAQVPTLGPITVGTGFASLYMPSARPLGPANDLGESTRQRRDTFSVGYKERVQVDIHGGGVWKWRRVVFTLKGDSLYDKGEFIGDWTQPFHSKAIKQEDSPLGVDMVRLIAQPTSEQANAIRDLIWDGHEGVDWSSEFTAKVSTTRVKVLSDKTFSFNPGNESGMSKTYRFWYPTRKNLIYADDEYGGLVFDRGAAVSVDSRLGMGDLYVYDVAYAVVPSSGEPTASMTWTPEGTYYWHER